MAQKYRFDSKKMEFRKVTHSVWNILGKVVGFFLATASLAVVYYVIFSLFITTDTDRQIKRRNQMYSQMYPEMHEKERLVGDVLNGLKSKDQEIYRSLFDADAPDMGVFSGDDLLSSVDTIPAKDIVDYVDRRLNSLDLTMKRIENNFAKVERAYSSKESLPPLSVPLESFSYARTGASVGNKVNPFYKVAVPHGGLDMVAQQGDRVNAAADGVVTKVTHSRKGLGNVIEITHDSGYVTRYAQVENTRVSKGQRVQLGKQIAQVGVSGNSFAPHLHYEVLKDSVQVDPVNFFFASVTPNDYLGMLFVSANTGQSLD